jgi:predicted PurR-regulated permease PerM
LIKDLLNKYGVPRTTAALSVLCIVVSLLITATSWQLAGLPNLRFVLLVAFLCPTLIAPPIIISLCRLTENLQNSQNEVMQVNTALQKSEKEKIKIYKAMIKSTHHILNNFLNQMMIFKLTAEDTPGFDHNVLSLYEKIIEDATTQIDALSSITTIDEISICTSVAPQPNTQSSTERVQQNLSAT